MPKLLDWEQLQEDIKIGLQLIDGNAKVSKGSGSVKGNGDVVSNYYMAECKFRSTDSFTINRETFQKVRKEAELLDKIPILATRNKRKETLITLSLTDFIRVAGLPKQL
jgi:Holliday junction resolvase